jgi:hypothetical protein
MATIPGSQRLLNLDGNNFTTSVTLGAGGTLLDSDGDAGIQGQILSSTGGATNWIDVPTDANNYVSGISFDTATGILTLQRSGLSDLTQDLDGRYLTSASNFYLNGITKSGNTLTFSVSGTTNQTYTFGSNAFNSSTIYAEPGIFSGGGTPTLASGVTGAEVRSLIGAGTGNGSSNLVIGTTSTTAMAGNITTITGAQATAITNNSAKVSDTGIPAILSNGATPTLNSGISAAEVRTLIGAGTSSSAGVTSVSGTANRISVTAGATPTVNAITAAVNSSSASLATGAQIQTAIDSAVTGVLKYIGTWDAATNVPTLVSAKGTPGEYYIVSTAGSTNLDGITDWAVGDWAVFSDLATDAWQKIDNTQVGNVTGSGSSGRVAYWNGSTNLTSDAGLTFNGSTNALTVSGAVTWSGGGSTESNSAYDNMVTGLSDSGTSTKTITITQQDGGTLTTSFSIPQGTTTPSSTETFTNKSGAISQWTNDSNYITSYVDTTYTAGSGLTLTGTVFSNTAPNVVQTTITGNAGSATVLQTPRTISGVSFNGSANITLDNKNITNGAGYTTNTGDITSVVAGTFLTGGGTSGAVTLNVSATSGATASTLVSRDSAADISARLFRANYANQSTISGAIAFRVNNSTDNYLRYCSSPSAIRAFIGAGTGTSNLVIGTTSSTAMAGNTTTISTSQASAITANTAKVGITSAQASAITANTAKVTDTGTPAILSNGSTPTLNSGISAAEVRTLIGAGTGSGTSNLVIGTTASTAMAGNTTTISSTQAANIVTNNAKVSNIVQTTVSGNAGSATKLLNARTIAGVSFNGTANIELDNANITNGAKYITSYVNTTYTAGTGLTLVGTEFRNTITNNNQLTNGASYLTTSGKAADSNLLDGLDLGGTRANVANKVVRTDGSGYTNFGWINTTSGNTTDAITDIYVNTNDGYIRKATAAQFRKLITDPYYSNNSGDITGVTAGTGMSGGGTSGTVTLNCTIDSPAEVGLGNLSSNGNVVAGNFTVGGSLYVPSAIYHTGDTNTYMQFHAVDEWRVVTGGVERFEVNNTQVSVTGNFVASGNVTAYSDERLKTNIETIPNALEKVNALRGVTFDKDGERGLGVIAQEVEKILPEVVMDGEEFKSVAYGNIVGVLIEAIKEQQLMIDNLETKVLLLTKYLK